MNQQTMKKMRNGVDMQRMEDTIAAVRQNPAMADFRFMLQNQWMDGSQNRSTINAMEMMGKPDPMRTATFVLDADEPDVLLGQDKAANPAEYLLHALAACMTTSLVYHASARGINIRRVESQLSGNIDLQGFLGLAKDVRCGYQNIKARFKIDSDAEPSVLKELFQFSPIYDTVSNPVPIEIEMMR